MIACVVKRGRFFVSFFRFYVVKLIKNTQKCKKNEKNAKKMQKNLHISKKCCTFAPNLKNNPISNPKINKIMKAELKFQNDGKKYIVVKTIDIFRRDLFHVYVWNKVAHRFDGAAMVVYHKCESNGCELKVNKGFGSIEEVREYFKF